MNPHRMLRIRKPPRSERVRREQITKLIVYQRLRNWHDWQQSSPHSQNKQGHSYAGKRLVRNEPRDRTAHASNEAVITIRGNHLSEGAR